MIIRRGTQSRLMIPEMQVREYIPSEFLPTDIVGLQLWLDFSDASKLFTDAAKTTPVSSDGDVIGAVEDKSGQGNDATQGTTSKKPTYQTGEQNGLSIGRFVTDDLLNADGLAAAFTGSDVPITIFIAFKKNGNIGTQQLFGFARNSSGQPLFSLDTSSSSAYRYIRRDDSSNIELQSAGTPDTAAHLTSAEFSGIVGTQRIDTVLIGSDGFNMDVGTLTLDKATIGARNANGFETIFMNGDIFEIIVYDTVLSDNNRTLVDAYINDKWIIF